MPDALVDRRCLIYHVFIVCKFVEIYISVLLYQDCFLQFYDRQILDNADLRTRGFRLYRILLFIIKSKDCISLIVWVFYDYYMRAISLLVLVTFMVITYIR